jgi:hypothetical protein
LEFTTEGINSNNPLPAYWPYIGRGLIQITLEANYRAYGEYVGENFTGNPDYLKMAQTPHCVKTIGWYWTVLKNLRNISDTDDFIMCTAMVNGGFNGYNDRLKYINSAIKALNIKPCAKLNRDGKYHLAESRAYNNAKFSFAWGVWSDPGSTKHGKTKNAEQALIG